MKKFFSIILLGAALTVAAFVEPSPVEAADPAPVETGYTQPVITNDLQLIASLISTQNILILADNSATLGVQVWQTGAAASATNVVTYTFDASLNGTNWVTGYRALAVTGQGTTTVNVMSNLTIGAVRKLRLATINNASAGSTPTNTVDVLVAKKHGL